MVFRFALKLTAIFVVACLLLAYSPGLLDIDPPYIEVPVPRPFTGSLQRNTKLESAEKLVEDLIHGPESLAAYEGNLYTGLHNGWIVRIQNEDTIEPIAKMIHQECEPWEEGVCGRPLGIRFVKNGTLMVADCYYGLHTIDINTGIITSIFRSSQQVDGKKPMIINDFDVSSTGNIYFSDSSVKFALKDAIYEMLESAPNGRILHHDLRSNITRTLVDGIAFPNGVQLSPQEDYLLIAETNRQRILKYNLKGENKGKLEIFVDNLPGLPDNIRTNGQGGYWVALCAAHPPDSPSTLTTLGPYPIVRRVFIRSIYVVRSVLQFLDRLFPSSIFKMAIYKMAHIKSYTSFEISYGMIFEISSKGEIIRSLHAPSGSLNYISEVAQIGNVLYLGSPWNRYIAKITL